MAGFPAHVAGFGRKEIETRPYLVDRRTMDGLEVYIVKIIKEIRQRCPKTWGSLPVRIIKYLIIPWVTPDIDLRNTRSLRNVRNKWRKSPEAQRQKDTNQSYLAIVDREFILSPARRGGGGAAAPTFTRQQAAGRQELRPLDLNLGLRHHPNRDKPMRCYDSS